MADAGRYHRQELVIGAAGQARLSSASVLIVGIGALGCGVADALVRAGVGMVRLADRDVVEWSNLQRQLLFTEADAHARLPKSMAAAARLAAVNSSVRIDPHAIDVTPDNIDILAHDVDLIIDGTDNFHTRYLLNDYSVKCGLPLIYGGALRSTAMAMTCNAPLAMSHPSSHTSNHTTTPPREGGRGACLRCLFPTPPAPGSQGTCDTVGVLAGAVSVACGLQAAMAVALLSTGHATESTLVEIDVMSLRTRSLPVPRDSACDCCAGVNFPYLTAAGDESAARLCGSDTYQVWPLARRRSRVDLVRLALSLASAGDVTSHGMFVRCSLASGEEVTVFADGRALIRGAQSQMRATSIYARLIGM
jgi:molybdopterin-synthase adenylyltransferase